MDRKPVPRNEPANFRIFLVGFAGDGLSSVSLVEAVKSLVPEAQVYEHRILHSIQGNQLHADDLRHPDAQEDHSSQAPEDGAAGENEEPLRLGGQQPTSQGRPAAGSVTSVGNLDFSSQTWIEMEALDLLGRLQKHTAHDTAFGSNLLLAGYGLGGIIIKQAIAIANTTPRFYDIAIKVVSLVFFSTPHRPGPSLGWEEVLLNLLRDARKSIGEPISRQLFLSLPQLANSVSWLSHSFYKFAVKYPTTNFIRQECEGDERVVFGGSSGRVVSLQGWLETTSDPEWRKAIRSHFTPCHIMSGFAGEDEALLRETSETYFETLQLFSVSPWIIYEPTTIDKSEDFDALTRLYRSLIRKISWKSFRGGSIQFTGPQEHGKSAVLKLAHQEISQRSSVVVIDNGKDAMSGYPEGLYGVLVFTLYQIISQKPPLYRSVHNLVSQLIHQHFWTEEVVKTLLSSIFLHSQDVDFVVVVYDFEQWQAEIRAWWLQLRSCFADPSSSTCTFMTSSEEPINGLAPPSLVQHFDLKADYPHQRKSWIGERARYHLDRAYNPSFIQRTLSQELEEEIVSAATKFHGSFAAVSSYLVHLSRSFTLNCPAAIRMNIQASVTSDKDLYQHQISLLESKPPPIRSWAVAILSWVLGAQRPLHVEELAVAAAITFRPISAISDIRDWVSTDMETDLRSHLGGLVELKNLRAHIVSPVARAILVDAEQQQKIGLTAGWELTSTLLGYLKAVFEEGKRDPNIWAKCNSYVSQRHKSEWPRDPALELVDYAARLWPLHFNLKEHQVDSETTALAAQFFNSPHLAKWWFQLYQLSNASLYPLSSQWGTSHQNTVDGIATTETLEDPAAPDTQSKALTPSPAQLAAYAGLKPVVISLLNTTVADRDVQMAVVRRGSTEHGILFMENESILHLDCAIAESDTKTIGRLLDLDAGMVKMRFPVHQASLMGKLEIVQLLHDKLSGPAQVDSDGRTSLHMAAVGGNVEIIGFIVSRQAHSLSSEEIILNKGDTNKKTPLMTAAHMGNAEAAQVLISLGADLLLRDRTGQTALHYAVSNCPQVVRLLVSRDPTAVNIADDAGRTPLHISAARGCGYFGSVAILLDAARKAGILPAAVGAEDKQSWTALHYAAAKGHPEASKLLVDAAKEVDVPLGNLAQPAALAASRGHVETLQVIAGERLDSGHLLAEASRAGQLLMTQYLLTKGLSPDGETLAHRVPLSEAASCGHGSIVHLLLEKGADINMRDSERRTPLHHAAKGGQREVVETLLCYQGGDGGDGANVNAPDDSRMTPLHHAAKGGHVEVVKLILENDRKVNVDALSTSRETPLHLSVKHPDVVSALLGAGADPNSADASHQTPLHMAAENGTLKSFQYLIEYNADPNITNDDGESPMHYAIAHNKVSIVEMLLGICLTAEEDDTSDSTSSKATRAWLKLAIERSALETLGFLLTKWPQAVEWTFTDRNRTLFHMAAEKNSKTDILACLFTAGSEVNHRCTAGRTPLHEAVSASNIEAVRKLLDWNAAVGEADNDGYTPLHLAALYGFDAILDLLLESGSPIDIRSTRGETSLLLAVEANQVDASKKLLQCGASVHLADEGKWTPLHVARDLKIAGLLLKSGADIDCLTSRLVTPLHIAISNRNLEGVKFLLGQGANANLADEEEMTALHYALQQPQEGVGPLIETLLGHHTIQLDKVDKQGVAPVHLAAQYAGVEVLQMLLEKGANFKTHTAAGKSALEIAAAADKGENVNLLLEKGYSVAPGLCWEITDLLVAYWAAVKEGSTGTIEKLVGKEPRLLESRTPEGLNGLELFLRSRLSRGLDINKLNLRSLPELFVTLGLNPFQRLKDDQMSAFELGVISNNELDNGFIRACLKHIPRDPQPPSFGFRELSIAVDIGDLQLWSKLEPALKCVREDSDQDDWNMAQFLHQAKPRVEFNSNITESFTNLEATTKQPTAIILPDIWKDFSAPIGTRFNISSDGLEASFESSRLSVSLRANRPFSPRKPGRTCYFEMTIYEVDPEVAGADGRNEMVFAIGFCGEYTNLTRALPGWYVWSAGYHGDDAAVFESNGRGKYKTGSFYGPGDTVGCGIDYERNKYFFTRNGKVVGEYSCDIIFRKIYPCVGHRHRAGKMKLNFGQNGPFLWAGANKSTFDETQQEPTSPTPRRASTFRWDT